MKCPVVQDECRHDSRQMEQVRHYSIALQQARDEFANGELDDQIQDRVQDQPLDAVSIALNAVFGFEVGIRRNRFIPAETDFRAMVEDIIEDRAQMILEDM